LCKKLYAYIVHRKHRRRKKWGGLLHWSAHKNHLKTAAKQTERRLFPSFPQLFPLSPQLFQLGPR